MSGQSLQELIDAKNQQRAALKREYLKHFTNPHAQGTGSIFDPAVQRYQSAKVSKIDYFRETPKTIMRGMVILLIPFCLTIYALKSEKDTREAKLRSGQVAYRDRWFKFV